MSARHILAFNSGSSSLKAGLYRVDAAGVDAAGVDAASVDAASDDEADVERLFSDSVTSGDQLNAIKQIASDLAASGLPTPDAIGHRIVHGGPALRQHCGIDAAVLRQLQDACAYAPLHNPAALALIGFAQAQYPGVPQFACFDTQFHADLPAVARVLPIARELLSDGIQRYGFHGLSLESIVRQLGTALPERMVIAHLGAGASVSAVKAGKSIDTSMGLTPGGGVIMGTRSGDLDPGLLMYLLRKNQFDPARLEGLLDQRSGLLGISGVSGDLRLLHEAAASNPDARLAIDMFCASVRKQIAAMITVLDGVDLLVFTGGIGENDAPVRAEICHGLSSMGIRLNASRNGEASKHNSNNPINDGKARCRVRVLAAREGEQIARHTWTLLK